LERASELQHQRSLTNGRAQPGRPFGGGSTLLLADVTARLSDAGCVAAADEAHELIDAASGDQDLLASSIERRARGEPLAWITQQTRFGSLDIVMHFGVYVPRWQSLELARRAVDHLPNHGSAIDLCTGSGAIALALCRARPGARVVASDVDRQAVACAHANGVDVRRGDLFEPLPPSYIDATDVVVAVAPYVPTDALGLLPRDTLRFEDPVLYDGGPAGVALLHRIIVDSLRYLRPGGVLLLELGGSQDEVVVPELERWGYRRIETWYDEDGDLRGVEATRVTV
jgi:release factor glutamine methyltransferase